VYLQAFIPEFAMEAFDVSVLPRLAGLDATQMQALAVSRFIQCLAGKFRPVVDLLYREEKTRRTSVTPIKMLRTD
jgi:hypothetical protein